MTEECLERVGRCWPRTACAVFVLFAVGCSDAGRESAEFAAAPPIPIAHTPRQAEVAWKARPLVPLSDQVQPTGLMSLPPGAFNQPNSRRVTRQPIPELAPLPPIDDAPTIRSETPLNAPPEANAGPTLLAPQPLGEQFTEWEDLAPAAEDSSPLAAADLAPLPAEIAHDASGFTTAATPTSSEAPTTPSDSIAPEAEALLADAGPAITGHATGAMVTEQAQARIRRGYKLAQRGAYFASRAEFVEVLRMIAEAKDQKRGAARRSVALANGLRALEEAADFAPRGAAVENQLDFDVVIASHRTPVAKESSARLMPQQLADMYYRYAQLQLGAAVAGEPAGSMALHALGKLYSQIGRAEPERIVQANRRAFALQQAALLARSDNHLAAHELGVLLAETGHYVDAEFLLTQVAMREPHPVVYRNLARVQRKLGRDDLAMASETQANTLAEQGIPSVSGVKWVDPQTLARMGDPLAPAAPPAQVAAGPPIPQPRQPVTTPSPSSAQAEPVHNVTRLPGGYFR